MTEIADVPAVMLASSSAVRQPSNDLYRRCNERLFFLLGQRCTLMPSRRRQFLRTLPVAAVTLAGCSTDAGEDSGGTPTERSSVSLGGDSTPDRSPVASSRWIEEPSEDMKVYSSDEPPVAELDEIVALFDRATTQDEWEPNGEDHRENPERGLGEPVGTRITAETYETIQNHYDRDEFYRGDTPGWIFDHDGTLVTLDIGKPSYAIDSLDM